MPQANAVDALCCAQNFITKASLLNVTFQISAPIALSMFLGSLTGITDMVLAGTIGADAQAAVGIGDQLIFLMIVLGTGLSTSISSFISRAAGGEDRRAILMYSITGLNLSIILGLIATAIGCFFTSELIAVFHCPPSIKELALPYARICSFANAPYILVLSQTAILRAIGLPRYSIYVQLLIAVVANTVAIVMFESPFDGGHSLKSLSYAWLIGCLTGAIAGSVILKKVLMDSKMLQFSVAELWSFKNFSATTKEITHLALPAMLSEFIQIAGTFAIYGLLAQLPDSANAQAAYTIKLKVEETISVIPLMALGLSSTIIVGQNLGAKQIGRANSACRTIAFVSSFIMLLAGIALAVSSDSIAAIFCSESVSQIKLCCLLNFGFISLPLLAASTIFNAGLEGAGESKTPMILNGLTIFLLRLVLAYLFAIHFCMGLNGLHLAVCISQAVLLFSLYRLFQNKLRCDES